MNKKIFNLTIKAKNIKNKFNLNQLIFPYIKSINGIQNVSNTIILNHQISYFFVNQKSYNNRKNNLDQINNKDLQQYHHSKLQILKTYLQAIPPKAIHDLVNSQEHYLQNIINSQSQISLSQIKKINTYIKKRMHLIQPNTLSKLIDTLFTQKTQLTQFQINKTLRIVIKSIKNRSQTLQVQHLVQFIYKLAKHNIKQPQIMKEVQNVIIQQKIKIYFPLVRKILWSYTHLDLGTPTLYSHICKTLKIGQHQFQPIQLAQSAYLLSKVTQNAIGGYGIYLIAQKHIEANLSRYKFPQLVQLAAYMLSQNIGSNKFQALMQQAIYNKYPASNILKAKHLVMLLKATSGYYFKYKDAALLYMLKASTMRQTQNATLQHFEDIIWSWGRSGKADKQLWNKLQDQVQKRIVFLKPRQIAFFYYSLCSYYGARFQLLEKLESMFLNLDMSSINEHLLIKFLLGMYRKKDFNAQSFSFISTQVAQKITRLSNKQLLTFIRVLNQSDIDFQSKNKFQSLQLSLKELGSKLVKRSYTLRQGEIVQLAYLWTKMQIDGNVKCKDILSLITELKQIPKNVFIKGMFCFLMQDDYQKVLNMIDMLQKLHKYGPLGYFFSPYDYPLLVYCIFHMKVKVKGQFQISNKMLMQLQNQFEQINPVILNEFVKKGYEQTKKLIEMYNEDKKK